MVDLNGIFYNKGMNRKNLDTPLTFKTTRGLPTGRKLLTVLVAAVIALAGLPAPVSQANYNDNPQLQTGFPVMLAGAPIDLSSPVTADLNGDGKLEIIVGGRALTVDGTLDCDGWVYAYKSDGTLYWQTRVQAPVNASPTVADLDKDGKPEVIVGLGGVANGTCWDGGVVALHGQDGSGWSKGTEVWSFDTQDWLNHMQDGWNDGVFASPAVGDITGDGWPEVVFGAWDQCIYALDHDGNPIWGNLALPEQGHCGKHGYYNADTIWSSPSLADVNGDRVLEIITGADITTGNPAGDPSGGYLYIFNGQGTVLAQTWLDQRIYSSPAVADIDNDQQFEIVVGTGTHLANVGYYVTAYEIDLSRPAVRDRLIIKWRSATGGRVFASPAIGDLNSDGSPDVVITSYIGNFGSDGGEVFGWDGRTGQQIFRTRTCTFMGQSMGTQSSPTLADIDGDGKLEVLFSHGWEVTILNHDGTYYTDYSSPSFPGTPFNPACARTVAPTTTKTYYAKWTVNASPAVADLDGNGKVEVIIGGGYDPDHPTRGGIYAWTNHANGSRPWPMFHHDAAHTGTTPLPPHQVINPTQLLALQDVNCDHSQRISVRLTNAGGGAFSWTATAPTGSGITISPSSGTVTTEATVLVTIPANGNEGTYDLGSIVFTANSVGGGVIFNGNAAVPVQLHVAELSNIFLPTVLR